MCLRAHLHTHLQPIHRWFWRIILERLQSITVLGGSAASSFNDDQDLSWPYLLKASLPSHIEFSVENIQLLINNKIFEEKPKSSLTKVLEILAEVGLERSMVDRYPHEFSGGQRQRIAIARSMILKPKLVILDEPTSALDKTVQVQIVKLLRELQQKYGLAYIFISHDLKVVRALSHNVIVMNNGDIVETGKGVKIFNSPESPYTKALISAAFGLSVK